MIWKSLPVLPGGTSDKEPACQGRRHNRLEFDSWAGKIPMENGMATHCSILAQRIPWTEKPGCKESDTTEATQQACIPALQVHKVSHTRQNFLVNKEKVLDWGPWTCCMAESNCWRWKKRMQVLGVCCRCFLSWQIMRVCWGWPSEWFGDLTHFPAGSLWGQCLGHHSPWPTIRLAVLVLLYLIKSQQPGSMAHTAS